MNLKDNNYLIHYEFNIDILHKYTPITPVASRIGILRLFPWHDTHGETRGRQLCTFVHRDTNMRKHRRCGWSLLAWGHRYYATYTAVQLGLLGKKEASSNGNKTRLRSTSATIAAIHRPSAATPPFYL